VACICRSVVLDPQQHQLRCPVSGAPGTCTDPQYIFSSISARDIFYASDFWAKHTCNARPSQDIWDALRRSPIPCRLGSHAMLPCVIKWLEVIVIFRG
jgi:hypothetical protein